MSGHEQRAGAIAGSSHEAGSTSHEADHAVFDGEPVTELAAGEPMSPMWLPVLGAGLFALLGIYWLLGDDPSQQSGAEAQAAAVATPNKPQVAAVRAAPNAPPRKLPTVLPGGAGAKVPKAAPGRPPLTPDELKRLRELRDDGTIKRIDRAHRAAERKRRRRGKRRGQAQPQ